MVFKSISEIHDSLKGIAEEKGGRFKVIDEPRLRAEGIDNLVYTAALSDKEELKEESRRIIRGCAASLGIVPSSIQNLYEAMGSGSFFGFTMPAINIRGITYDTARAIFTAGRKLSTNLFIFEIAKSEIDYTMQRPKEYASCVLAAAIKENYRGPVFLQGDHFQVNAKKYSQDKSAEITSLKSLIKEALDADFLNIDIDSSTIVDLSKKETIDQQRPNFEVTAALTVFIREMEKTTVSIGGEIGEVGGKNSTIEELRAFMDGYRSIIGSKFKGISKISVQTGTSHGGIALPDGTIAKVKVDFDTIEKLSDAARKDYGLSGVVQHGASTLPDESFDMFVKKRCAEVHLATGFQNMIYDSPAFPAPLKEEIYKYLKEKFSSEAKPGETEEQFIYKTRKKGFGPFKEKMWTMPEGNKRKITGELTERFELLFKKLNVVNTDVITKRFWQNV